jgi:CBS domain-containing protein
MLVKDLCVPNVVTCDPHANILDAARLMRQHHVGDVVVVDDPKRVEGVPLGIITDRDLAIEVLGRGLDPAVTKVVSVMRKPVVVAYETEHLTALVDRMRAHGVRRMPVVANEGEIIGIVSLEDVLRGIIGHANALLDTMSQGRMNEQRARG